MIAALLKRGEDVKLVYVHQGITRAEALIREREEIARLCQAGFVLAYHQHNEGTALDVDEIVRTVLERASSPINHAPTERPVVPSKPIPPKSPARSREKKCGLSEAEILAAPLYDAVVIATNKTTRLGDFLHLV